MKTKIVETLARASVLGAFGFFAATTAQAAVLPLQNAVVTATFNGSASNWLSLDSNFNPGPGSNVSGIHTAGAGVEFITADAMFGFDFDDDGTITIFNNLPVDAGTYNFRFDFAGLALPITSFVLGANGAVSGAPVLSILDGGLALGLDLSGVDWGSGFATISASAGAEVAQVPEPGGMAVLMAGLGAIALVRRRQAGTPGLPNYGTPA